LFASEVVSTQDPLQSVNPAAEQEPQTPPLQTWPEAQSASELQLQLPPRHCWLDAHPFPQPPQLSGSEFVFEQSPLQFVSCSAPAVLDPDEHAHTPPLQIWSFVHTLPHAPQFAGSSELVFAQTPLQFVLAPSEHAHTPPLQNWLEGHVWPHAPQLAESEDGSVHWPEHFIIIEFVQTQLLVFGSQV
jgi:hypothetical protein